MKQKIICMVTETSIFNVKFIYRDITTVASPGLQVAFILYTDQKTQGKVDIRKHKCKKGTEQEKGRKNPS